MDLNRCVCSGRTLARLLRPAVLALLADEDQHGYVLVRRLGELEGFTGTPDSSGVYKVLKDMADEGLVEAAWEAPSSGPARRRFAITERGRACLARWRASLVAYRRQIDDLIGLVERSAGTAP